MPTEIIKNLEPAAQEAILELFTKRWLEEEMEEEELQARVVLIYNKGDNDKSETTDPHHTKYLQPHYA